jgi:outer membrane protein OmpA-like peptidoglycan-associated protein
MSPRRTILYLFLASCLSTTNARPQGRAPHPDTLSPRLNLHPTDTIIVHFDVDRFSLSSDADSIIDQYFTANKTSFTFGNGKISGYCDYTGMQEYNNQLSLNRARTVNDYLRQHWLDSTMITTLTGYGTRYPVSDNRTEAGRAENRRVTITIQRTAIEKTTVTQEPDTPRTPASPPSIYKAITDSATRIGSSIILEDVDFYGGRHIPLPTSYFVLDDLVKAMKVNDKLRIRIEGHVCCRRDDTDGPDRDTGKHDLSVQRARVVYDYLRQNGISKHRMSYIGLGAAGKLYPEEIDAVQRSANRRVEIRIISK